MKLRWINIDNIEPKFGMAFWEYPRITTPNDYILLTSKFDRRLIELCSNNMILDDCVYIDKIPSDVDICRHHCPNNYDVGPGIWSDNVIVLYLHTPQTSRVGLQISTLKTLRKRKIRCYKNNFNCNDIFYIRNNNSIKFFGSGIENWNNGWCSELGMLSFKPDMSLMKNILKINVNKFLKKESFNELEDIAGGLWDCYPSLEIDSILRDISNDISNSLNVEFIEDELNVNELKRINGLANKLDSYDWIHNIIHPELGNVYRRNK